MFRFDADLQVYLHRKPIHFQAGLNTLVTLVEQSMPMPMRSAVILRGSTATRAEAWSRRRFR